MSFSLEDSTTENIPPMLENIVKQYLDHNTADDSIQINLMLMIILVQMIECGYLPLDKDNVVIDIKKFNITEYLKKWQLSTGAFEITFIMCGFDNIPLKLILSPVGATVLVNLVIKDFDSETYSVCLPFSDYIVSLQAKTIPMIFRDLRHISMILKNKILSAVKSRVLSYHGYASASLIGLPEETLTNILMYLPIIDILRVSKTCKRLNYYVNKEILWHSLYKRDFGVVDSEVDSWKTLYKEKHLKLEDERLHILTRNAGTMHDYMEYSDFVSYIDNPMWDVII